MFSFQHSDDLVSGNPNYYQPDIIWDDLLVDFSALESNITDFSTSTARFKSTQQQQQSGIGLRQSPRIRDVCNNNNNKRVSHRDIERKRRQEMSTLYSSLRNLLPSEHIKGKRSTCDHMQEAVNYIQHMQQNIKELQIRRDKLKKLSNSSLGFKCGSSNGGDDSPNFVTVNVVHDGVEILIQSCSDFGISRVLSQLLEKDVNVFSCVSTKTNGMFLHKMMAEAIDLKSIDTAVLQERLRAIID